MRNITLTRDERHAIDWIGDRYFHGNDLYRLLWKSNTLPDDADWDDSRDITFSVSDETLSKIREGIKEEDSSLSCFSPELKTKLLSFIEERE